MQDFRGIGKKEVNQGKQRRGKRESSKAPEGGSSQKGLWSLGEES